MNVSFIEELGLGIEVDLCANCKDNPAKCSPDSVVVGTGIRDDGARAICACNGYKPDTKEKIKYMWLT